jgi:rhodanese-related sulfurtransferase
MRSLVTVNRLLRVAGLVTLLIGAGSALVPTAASAQGGVGSYASGVAPSGADAVITAGHFGLIADRAYEVLSGPLSPTVQAPVLVANLADYYVVDIRSHDTWCAGHIPGAVNMPWPTEIVEPENLDILPTGMPIAVVCYTGHTASQTTMLFNLLGYEASALRYGFTSWDPESVDPVYPLEVGTEEDGCIPIP